MSERYVRFRTYMREIVLNSVVRVKHGRSALSLFSFAVVIDYLTEVRQESLVFRNDVVICSESRELVDENLDV